MRIALPLQRVALMPPRMQRQAMVEFSVLLKRLVDVMMMAQARF